MLALDDRDLQPSWRGADGGDIAAGPGADDRQIEARHGRGSGVRGTTTTQNEILHQHGQSRRRERYEQGPELRCGSSPT